MITGKNAELYFGESVYKQMNIEVVGTGIVIDNSMREQDTFTLTETLCDSSELKFGSCLPNQISFVGREIPASIKGKRLHPVEILEGNEDDPFEYGTYTVYSDVPTSDRTKRQITAYDAMYDIINADVKSWYAGLTFPMTLKAFRDSFFAHLGIAQKETTLVNDGMTVNKTLTATQTDSESTITEESAISGKTVIEAICEINGVFGNINRDGLFEYVELEQIIKPLYPSNDLYPREDLFPRDPNSVSLTGHYITFDYEDFQSKAITQLEIRSSDDSAGVIVGTSGNNYVISGNFLVSDKTGAELETIAENTLSVIKKAAYIPIKSSEIVGNPCIELGDPIRFNTTREIIESYVLQRTLTGIQSKRDSITASGTETHSANVNSIKYTISNLSGRTNKLERTADHTLSEIKAVDSKVNELDSSVQESVSELDSKIEQTASSITTEVSQKVTEINNSISTVDGKVNNVDEKVDDLSSTVTTSVSELNSKIEQTASSIRSEVNETLTKTYSTKEELSNTVSNADAKAKGYASTAENNANASTDDKLKKYSTITEMTNLVEQTASGTKEEITKIVSDTYSTKTEAQGYASAAESNANSSTDAKLGNYSTTTEMKAEIEKSASGIKQTVSENHYSKSEIDDTLDGYATSEEVSTKFSQTARKIEISASGEDNSVGITIQLYDENGNLIDTKSDTANITITGFVSFQDLENAGQTTINGANITTGSISCDRLSGGTIKGQKLEGCKAEFSDGAESLRLKYSDDYYMGLRAGYIYFHNKNPGYIYQSIVFDNMMRIGVNSNADCWGNGIGSLEPTYYIEINKYGGINFNCINLTKNNSTLATKSDIPDMSDYLKKNASGNFNADYATSAGGVSDGSLSTYKGQLAFSQGTSGTSGTLYYKNFNGRYYLSPSGSSIKIKHDVRPVCNPELDPRKLYDLRVVQFKFNDLPIDDKLYENDVIGFIAEEVAEVYPLGAEYNENGEPSSWWDRYLIPPMLYLIQEQHKDIESLKQENLALQNRLSILESRMEELYNVINNKNN